MGTTKIAASLLIALAGSAVHAQLTRGYAIDGFAWADNLEQVKQRVPQLVQRFEDCADSRSKSLWEYLGKSCDYWDTNNFEHQGQRYYFKVRMMAGESSIGNFSLERSRKSDFATREQNRQWVLQTCQQERIWLEKKFGPGEPKRDATLPEIAKSFHWNLSAEKMNTYLHCDEKHDSASVKLAFDRIKRDAE